MNRIGRDLMWTPSGMVLLLAIGLLVVTPSASAQDPQTRRPGMLRQQAAQQEGITFNFQNLDLAYVVTAMGQAAGINVLSTSKG